MLLKKVFWCCILSILASPGMILPANAEPLVGDLMNGPVLSLRSALTMGIERNLELQAVKLDVPIKQENVTTNEAEFDTALDASISSLQEKTPTASTLSDRDSDRYRATGGDAGISKKFRFGLESRLSFETTRSGTNSSNNALDPEYRDYLVLDLTQPLLRDFGTDINTANLKISQNQVRQAAYGYLEQAQGLARKIEIVYYDMARALELLSYRIDSRGLALELFKGNQKKFEAGVVPVSEVQEAETAVASRDEQIVFAIQRVEALSNRLKDLLDIRPGDPLYAEFIVTDPVAGVENDFPDLENALTIALKRRPDLQKERFEIANHDIQIEYYQNQKLPRIDLESTLGVNGLSGRTRYAPSSGTRAWSSYEGNYADSFSSMAKGDGHEWCVGLRFSYPLGNRAAKANYRRSEQEKRQAIYRLKRLEGAVETEIKNALVTIRRSIERVTISERFEKLAKTTLDQEMERLKKGLSDTFRTLNFQDEVIEARIRKVTALADFKKGLAGLYHAMGANLERFHIIAEIN